MNSKILILLLFLSAICVPALADTPTNNISLLKVPQENIMEFPNLGAGAYSFNSVQDDRVPADTGKLVISNSYIQLLQGQSVNFTWTTNGGVQHTGWALYQHSGLFGGLTACGLDNQQTSWTFFDIPGVSCKMYIETWGVTNATTTTKQYYLCFYQTTMNNAGYSIIPQLYDLGIQKPILYVPISGKPSDDPIVQADFYSPTGINTITFYEGLYGDIATTEALHESGNASWIDWLLNNITLLWNTTLFLFVILSWFFNPERLLLFFFLIEGCIFAYRLNTESNIFTALSAAGQDNIQIYNFVSAAISLLIEMVTRIINALKPI